MQYLGGLFGLALYGAIAVAWITHVVVCIQTKAWVLLVIGSLLAPVGAIHGVMIWLGVPWT